MAVVRLLLQFFIFYFLNRALAALELTCVLVVKTCTTMPTLSVTISTGITVHFLPSLLFLHPQARELLPPKFTLLSSRPEMLAACLSQSFSTERVASETVAHPTATRGHPDAPSSKVSTFRQEEVAVSSCTLRCYFQLSLSCCPYGTRSLFLHRGLQPPHRPRRPDSTASRPCSHSRWTLFPPTMGAESSFSRFPACGVQVHQTDCWQIQTLKHTAHMTLVSCKDSSVHRL